MIRKAIAGIRHSMIQRKVTTDLYGDVNRGGDSSSIRVSAFNRVWYKAYSRFDFYKSLKAAHNLPDHIERMSDLADFPVVSKEDIVSSFELILKDSGCRGTISTGGSTGQPSKFPYSKYDHQVYYRNMYKGRSWWGISPGDRILMIWGHGHAFGSGMSARLGRIRRFILDSLVCIDRVSAYALDDESLKEVIKKVEVGKYKCIIGYSSYIESLIDYANDHLGGQWRGLQGKLVIVTSESVSDILQEKIRISGGTAIIEYGSAETGVMGYSNPKSSEVSFLTESFYVRSNGNHGDLLVTTLWDKAFPLINYNIGDCCISPAPSTEDINGCKAILGRSNDLVRIKTLAGGEIKLHSEFFTHAIKSTYGVESFYLKARGKGFIDIYIKPRGEFIMSEVMKDISFKIAGEMPEIDMSCITFRITNDLPYTPAGKRRYIVQEGA